MGMKLVTDYSILYIKLAHISTWGTVILLDFPVFLLASDLKK